MQSYGGSALNTSNLQNAAGIPAPPTASAMLLRRLEDTLSAVREAGNRTRNVADNHFGPAPESDAKNGAGAVPNGTLGQMNELHDALDRAVGYLGTQLTRLEAL